MATPALDVTKVAIVGAGVMGEAMIHALNRLGINCSEITIRENESSESENLLRNMALRAIH